MTDTDKISGRSDIASSAEALGKDRRSVESELELIEICYGLACRWKMIIALAMVGLISVSTYLWRGWVFSSSIALFGLDTGSRARFCSVRTRRSGL